MSGTFEGLARLVEAASASQLALAAFLSIAVAGLCYKFFNRAKDWVKLLAFFGVLLFAFQLSIKLIVNAPSVVEGDKAGDPVKLIALLGAFPPAERLEKCVLAAEEKLCTKLVASIAGLSTTPASPSIQKAVSDALTKGSVSASLVQSVERAAPQEQDQVLTLGQPNGWDIDVFWCRGANEEAHFSQAQALANSLTVSKQFGNYPRGRVRVRALSVEKQQNPGYPNSGLQIRGEAGEQGPVTALANFFSTNSNGAKFTPFVSGMKTPWYLSAFVCSVPSIS